jgi:FkbM family methyltransferase
MIRVEKCGVEYVFEEGENDWFTKKLFNNWENGTFLAFDKVKDPSKIAIDIGAWIGTTAVWLSKNFKDVVAVEADTQSLKFLRSTLFLSGCTNVSVCENPIFSKKTTVVFGTPTGYSGNPLNTSMSKIKDESDSAVDYTVSTITLSDILEKFSVDPHNIGLIKCDIEGGEEHILQELLEFAEMHDVDLYMSFHTDWWKEHTLQDFEPIFSKWGSRMISDTGSNTVASSFDSVLFMSKRHTL